MYGLTTTRMLSDSSPSQAARSRLKCAALKRHCEVNRAVDTSCVETSRQMVL